jgi:hypothetical protein
MVDGSNHKSIIDNFILFAMMQVTTNGANQPSTNDVLEQEETHLALILVLGMDFF